MWFTTSDGIRIAEIDAVAACERSLVLRELFDVCDDAIDPNVEFAIACRHQKTIACVTQMLQYPSKENVATLLKESQTMNPDALIYDILVVADMLDAPSLKSDIVAALCGQIALCNSPEEFRDTFLANE